MTELPVLATAADIAETLSVPEQTVRSLALEPVGRYLPPGSRTTVELFNVSSAQEALRRRP